ncbi:hypothetical protein CWO91_01725 [Bradyrhizobium genosp. SA-3]|nr:hypothetical protein CWO91_01725 [Bradyrhizobium genosp. SA-3]
MQRMLGLLGPGSAPQRRCVAARPGHERVARHRHTLRHCEELLRRSNPDCHRGGILDCFAALAMTTLMQLRRRRRQRLSTLRKHNRHSL